MSINFDDICNCSTMDRIQPGYMQIASTQINKYTFTFRDNQILCSIILKFVLRRNIIFHFNMKNLSRRVRVDNISHGGREVT